MIPNSSDKKVIAILNSGESTVTIAELILDRAKEIIMMGSSGRDQSYKKKIANLPTLDEVILDIMALQGGI